MNRPRKSRQPMMRGEGDGCSPATQCGMRGSPGDDEAQEEQAAHDEGERGWLLYCYLVWNER